MSTLETADGGERPAYADLPLRSPAPPGGLLEVLRRPYLLRLIVLRQLAKQYSGSFLGFFWSYLQPGTRFLVYYFVIAVVLKQGVTTPNFAIHLFTGLVAVQFFVQSFGLGTRSVQQNRQLVSKMAIPREIFPVSAVVVAAFHTVPMLLFLTLACGLVGWHGDWTGVLAILLGFTMLATFAIGTALLFSAFNVYFRDFQNLVATITQFMHFMVPMIYPYTRLSESIGGTWWEQLYLANPVASAVLLLQRGFWDGVSAGDPTYDFAGSYPPHLIERGWIMLAIGIVFLLLSQLVFRRLENKFPERL